MKKVVVMLMASLAFAACNPPGPTHLPVQTINFAPDGAGSVQFYTNDTANLNKAYLAWYTSATLSSTPWTVSATIQKKSGAMAYGTGVAFCVAGVSDFYVVL